MALDIDLSELSEHELVELNHRIVARLKTIRQRRNFESIAAFELGEEVSFDPEPGRTLVGTVTRLNKKTITVTTEAGEFWRVGPGLLRKVHVSSVDVQQQPAQQTLVPFPGNSPGRKKRRRRR